MVILVLSYRLDKVKSLEAPYVWHVAICISARWISQKNTYIQAQGIMYVFCLKMAPSELAKVASDSLTKLSTGGLSKNLHHCWLFAPASAVEGITLVRCVCVCVSVF